MEIINSDLTTSADLQKQAAEQKQIEYMKLKEKLLKMVKEMQKYFESDAKTSTKVLVLNGSIRTLFEQFLEHKVITQEEINKETQKF